MPGSWRKQKKAGQRTKRSRSTAAPPRAFLVGALAIAAFLAVVAVLNGRQAQDNFVLAVTREAEAQNVALVAGSQAALANDDTDTALALAWQAVTLHPDSALAQAQLSVVAYSPGTVRQLLGHQDWVLSADINPDGQKALSGSMDKTVRYWDLETGETLWTGEAHENGVRDVAISPDGRIAASVSDEATILWDLATGQIIRRQVGHEEFIWRAAFSPDGRHLATGGWGHDPSIVLWDVASGQLIDRFPAESSVEGIAYTPDGSTILTIGFDDGILRKIDSETGDIIQEMDAGLGIFKCQP